MSQKKSEPGKNGTSSSLQSLLKNKSILSWALYDAGNSAFATTVMAGFFPLFFKQYWSSGTGVSESTFYLGSANSLASLALALSAPLLGVFADLGQHKKRFLFFFMITGVLGTGALFTVPQGLWPWAILLYIVGSLGYTGGNIFYDSLMTDVGDKKNFDTISGLGFSLGYLGGGLLFVVNVLMYLKPHWFGLTDGVIGVRWAFVTVAVWWLLFSLPLFFYVHEHSENPKIPRSQWFTLGFRQLYGTFRDLRHYKVIVLFLVGYLFYIDGVNTIIKMAVDYGMSLGFQSSHLITALIITQFVAFPAALGFGYLGQRRGAKFGIVICLLVYALITIYAYFMTSVTEFYLLATAIGLVQGGLQALSRSLYAQLIPAQRSGEFFGFFNMLGKFSAVFGPILVGAVSLWTKNPRLSILVILAFFVIGGFFLFWHDRERTKVTLKANFP